MKEERRKSPRLPVEVELQLWRDDRIEKRARGLIKNITLEGLCVETELTASVGTNLIFMIDTPLEFKFNIYGNIIWVKKIGKVYRYGTKFTNLDITEKPDLYKFVLVTMCLNEQRK